MQLYSMDPLLEYEKSGAEGCDGCPAYNNPIDRAATRGPAPAIQGSWSQTSAPDAELGPQEVEAPYPYHE